MVSPKRSLGVGGEGVGEGAESFLLEISHKSILPQASLEKVTIKTLGV